MSQSSRLLDKEVAEQLGLDVIPGDEWDDVDWWEITPEGRRVLRPYSTSLDVAWTLPVPLGASLDVFAIGITAAARISIPVSSRMAETDPQYTTCPNTPSDVAAVICRLWLSLHGKPSVIGAVFGVPVVDDARAVRSGAGTILRILPARWEAKP
jgi:hypothetical protein